MHDAVYVHNVVHLSKSVHKRFWKTFIKINTNSNVAKHVLENIHTIIFNTYNDFDILNVQNNIYINSVLEALHIYKKVKSNILYQYIYLYIYLLTTCHNCPFYI